MNSTRIVCVLSLALGTGLAVALVSIADAILFRPLPVKQPGGIVRVYSASPLHSLGYVSYLDYQDFKRGARTLTGLIAQSPILIAFGGQAGEAPEVHLGLAVSSNYFDVLGVPAHLGRTFRSDEARQPVAVLGDSLWRMRFASDGGIVGHTVQLSGTPFTVIGIAPPGFGLDRFLHEDFYVPIEVYAAGLLPGTGRPLEERGRHYLSIYGRRSGSISAVQAELSSIAAHLGVEYPATNRQQKVVVMTELAARLAAPGSVQATAWGLLALAALSLTVACSNVTGLLLLQNEARAGDIALKVALGASPLRLLRESLLESLALAAAGTIAAMPLAWAALKIASRLWVLPTDLPMAMDARIDARMALVAAGATLLVTLLCATAPARITLHIASLRHTNTNSNLLGALVIVQVALAAGLVGSGASLFAQMTSAGNLDLGYRTEHILLMTFDPSQTRTSESRTRAFYRELLERAAQLPGVRAAALAQSVPLGFTAAQKQVKLPASGADPMALWMNTVTPGYFELMRMPLVDGRAFLASDTEHTPPVTIVNQALAQFWPDHHAVGQIIEIDGHRIEIVGVVKTAQYQQAGEPPKPFFYLPYSQNFVPRLTLHILTQGAPFQAAPAVLAAARALDPSQPATEIRPFDQLLSQGALFGARIGIAVTAAAGGCAWLMSLTGVYVCVARSVTRRRREIAIRRALGAGRGAITRLVLIEGIRLTAAGSAIGAVLAIAADRWIRRVVSTGVTFDLGVVLALAIATVAATSLAACLVPARRASSYDPAVTLRSR